MILAELSTLDLVFDPIFVRIFVFVAVVAVIWFVIWFVVKRKQTKSRRGQVDDLVDLGFSVQRTGVINEPGTTEEITSAAGRLRGYELHLRVDAVSSWDVITESTAYTRYTSIAVRLRNRMPDMRVAARVWVHRKPPPPHPAGDDSGGVAVGCAAFDDNYLLFCADPAQVRAWLPEDLAYRLATDPGTAKHVSEARRHATGEGLMVHEDELWLCIKQQAEKLDLADVVDYVARLAELFDEAGDRLARVGA